MRQATTKYILEYMGTEKKEEDKEANISLPYSLS